MSGDELLTVRRLLASSGEMSRLAVLSACESGTAGIRLPSEFIGLPAAFIQVGFAGVIASHSAVNVATALLMHRFYSLWPAGDTGPTDALRRAQAWLRDSTKKEKASWYDEIALTTNGARRAAALAARQAIEPALAKHANERTFAHPYWWAGVSLTGA